MECHAVRSAILDRFDTLDSSGTDAGVLVHLEACAACAAFDRRHQQLDDRLTAVMIPPTVGAGFRARVRAQIQHDAMLGWRDLAPDIVHLATGSVAIVGGVLFLPV